MMQQQAQAGSRGNAPSAGPVGRSPVMGGMYAPMKNPSDLSLMKSINRWAYFEEFLQFWLEGKKHVFLAGIGLVLGLFLLTTAPVLAMVAFFFSAKWYGASQIQTWISKRFGKGRTVILVN